MIRCVPSLGFIVRNMLDNACRNVRNSGVVERSTNPIAWLAPTPSLR
jgi:hypothetical protein